MERVIAEARRNSQPAYIVVPSDHAQAPVTLTEVRPLTLKSNEASLAKAVAAPTERVKNARSIVVLPAFTLSRVGLQKEAQEAIEALGCAFATTAMKKSIIDESHPQCAGMYSGELSTKGTREIVERAELVIDLGGVSLNDETTMGFPRVSIPRGSLRSGSMTSASANSHSGTYRPIPSSSSASVSAGEVMNRQCRRAPALVTPV